MKNTETKEHRIKRLAGLEYQRHYSFATIWTRKYADMRARTSGQRSKRCNSYGKSCLSKEEFTKWCTSQPQLTIFIIIYMDWVRSGFNVMLSPSVDRIDNNKGYTIDNMEWMTLMENMEKHDKPIDWTW